MSLHALFRNGKSQTNAEENSDTVIELYGTDGQSLLFDPVDEQGPGEGEFLEWYVPAAGIYYVRVRQYDPGVYGEGTGYDLRVYKPVQPGDGWIQGTVADSSTGGGLGNATITLAELPEFETKSFSSGFYQFCVEAGTYTLRADTAGYNSFQETDVDIPESTPLNPKHKDIPMDKETDYPASANARAATYGAGSVTGSGVLNEFILILVPLGTVVLLRRLCRKK